MGNRVKFGGDLGDVPIIPLKLSWDWGEGLTQLTLP